MSQVFVFVNPETNSVAVGYPTNFAAEHGFTADDLAKKDVPEGVPYGLIDDSLLPDGLFQSAWEIDETTLTDGVGAVYSTFDEMAKLATPPAPTESSTTDSTQSGTDSSSATAPETPAADTSGTTTTGTDASAAQVQPATGS